MGQLDITLAGKRYRAEYETHNGVITVQGERGEAERTSINGMNEKLLGKQLLRNLIRKGNIDPVEE